jgi:hypothetical protein
MAQLDMLSRQLQGLESGHDGENPEVAEIIQTHLDKIRTLETQYAVKKPEPL